MPVNIHGKEYLTVVERLDMMKKATKGDYSINTELLKFEGGCIIMKAALKIGSNVYTGTAMEEIGSSKINSTSALENCETSSIGRALASAGFHGTALAQQEKPKAKKVKTVSKPKVIVTPD